MKPTFWIRRFAVVFAGAFALLFVVNLAKGRSMATAATESALWGAIAAGIFVATRFIRSRRGEACELCGDPPGQSPGEAGEAKPPDRRS